MSRPFIMIALAIFAFAMAGLGYWLAIDGLMSGVVDFPSKSARRLVSLASSPRTYWACVGFWMVEAVAFSILGILQIRNTFRA